MSLLSPNAAEALDRMDFIANCWEALGELLNPDDIQPRQRDRIALLAGFLVREYDQARNDFSAAIKEDRS